MGSEKLLDIYTHEVFDNNIEDEAYDVKIEKLVEILKELHGDEGQSNPNFERTLILMKDDLNIPIGVSFLIHKGRFQTCRFTERNLEEHHSFMDENLEAFKSGTSKFAMCSMSVFKKIPDIIPADHYVFFEMPKKIPDTGKLMKMLDEKAKVKKKTLRVDILTTETDKPQSRIAFAMEMSNRQFTVPDYMRPPIPATPPKKEPKPVKRQRTPSPSVYDIKPDERGIYVIPAKFLRVKRFEQSDDQSDDEEEEMRIAAEHNEDEYLPSWWTNM